MKNTLFALTPLLFLTAQAFAQADTKEATTLFKNGGRLTTERMGFFVAPAVGLTQLDDAAAALFHVRGGLNFSDVFSFGGFYNASMHQIVPKSETLANIYMDYWSAGGLLEFTAFAKKLVHVTFPIQVGIGEVQMDNEEGDAELGEANFAVIEPAALIELNLHKYVRLNVGAGYRWISDMEYRNFDQRSLAGLTGYAGLRFGWFR